MQKPPEAPDRKRDDACVKRRNPIDEKKNVRSLSVTLK